MFKRSRKVVAEGERVYLYEPSRSDGSAFVEMTTSSTELHQPWVFPATDLERYKLYMDRLKSGRALGFFLADRSTDALAGAVNINDIVLGGFRTGSLGYYIGADWAGKGLMTEGLGLVLDQAFGPFRLNRLEANIQPENQASLALVRRLGFRYEGYSPKFLKIDGEWRDHERWAILADEWHGRLPQSDDTPVHAAL